MTLIAPHAMAFSWGDWQPSHRYRLIQPIPDHGSYRCITRSADLRPDGGPSLCIRGIPLPLVSYASVSGLLLCFRFGLL